MQHKAIRLDYSCAVRHLRCDVNFKASVACGDRHRQAVREKIPILGDNEEDAHALFPIRIVAGSRNSLIQSMVIAWWGEG
jgi:hypothetical protein